MDKIMMVLPELLVSTSILSIALLLWGVLGSWWKEECRIPGKAIFRVLYIILVNRYCTAISTLD